MDNTKRILERTVQLARLGGFEIDPVNKTETWSDITKQILEVPKNYKPEFGEIFNFFAEGSGKDNLHKSYEQAIKVGSAWDFEAKVNTAQNRTLWVRTMGSTDFKNGRCELISGTIQDVNDQKSKIKTQEEKYRNIISNMDLGILEVDDNDIIHDANKTFQVISGYSLNELKGKRASDLLLPKQHKKVIEKKKKERKVGKSDCYELPVITKDGEERWWLVSGSPNYNSLGERSGSLGIHMDITEQKRMEESLRQSLEEKETLLTEIHHRVKNNLAVVSSMMFMQAYKTDNEELRAKLLDSAGRIRTMVAIHEQLYQAESFASLDLPENLEQLISSVLEMMKSTTNINLDLDCQPIGLSVYQAVPFFLIVNELITNTIKHAFEDQSNGTINVKLYEKQPSAIYFSIADNGKGLPEEYEQMKDKSLGLNIINVLSQQLEAEYEFDTNEKGTQFSMEFKKG